MTKLIAAGCSNTSQGGRSIGDKRQRYTSRGIITWPQIVAERMGWDFVNVAVGGCDNAFIENTIYDEVESTPNGVDIVVMSLWTCPIRYSAWGQEFFSNIMIPDLADDTLLDRAYPGIHREDWQELPVGHFNENVKHANWTNPVDHYRRYLICQLFSLLREWDYKEIMKHSARSINRTMNWLDDIGIKNYHESGLGFIHHQPPVREEYIAYGKTLNMNLDHWELGFLHELLESELLPCLHPNQAGQDKIAKMFIDKMEGKYVPLNTHSMRGKSAKIEAFIYD